VSAETVITIVAGAIEAMMKLYYSLGGGMPDLVKLAADCNLERVRIANQQAADEKAARDAVPK